ncbi:MAG: hypothetical protein E6Q88_13920 [Lysobacteraceae bacterium]|nr:MAG: hypothetical protein E6Q88_13920 [Xanthomonadaceae bacterium]
MMKVAKRRPLLKINDIWYGPEKVWKMIREDFIRGNYKVLRIAHCNAGMNAPGNRSAAEIMSEIVNKEFPDVVIEATDRYVWFQSDGKLYPGDVPGDAGILWGRYQNGLKISGPRNLITIIIGSIKSK